MIDRIPWTMDELRALLPAIEARLDDAEAAFAPGAVRPLPPLTVDEAREHVLALIDKAQGELLTGEECFLAGQLLACHAMAVRAETLGKPGRYFVVSEDDFVSMMRERP
jgi:hypothetical protein